MKAFKSTKAKIGFVLAALALTAYFGWGLWTTESAEILGVDVRYSDEAASTGVSAAAER